MNKLTSKKIKISFHLFDWILYPIVDNYKLSSDGSYSHLKINILFISFSIVKNYRIYE